jgi:hypothetical protein
MSNRGRKADAELRERIAEEINAELCSIERDNPMLRGTPQAIERAIEAVRYSRTDPKQNARGSGNIEWYRAIWAEYALPLAVKEIEASLDDSLERDLNERRRQAWASANLFQCQYCGVATAQPCSGFTHKKCIHFTAGEKKPT